MRLYLDDDTAASVLFKLLTAAGHDVAEPVGEGMMGETDPMHLIHAIEEDRAFMTHNYDDFKELHDLISVSNGHHPGIVVIRKDNDSVRDLTPRGIVTAVRKLEQAMAPVADQYIILNQWR